MQYSSKYERRVKTSISVKFKSPSTRHILQVLHYADVLLSNNERKGAKDKKKKYGSLKIENFEMKYVIILNSFKFLLSIYTFLVYFHHRSSYGYSFVLTIGF